MQAIGFEVRVKLARYLAGNATLKQFREWFVPQAWDVDKRADTATADVVHQVDLLLAEFENGDWTEEELKKHLELAIAYPVTALPGTHAAMQSSAEAIIWTDLTWGVPTLEFVDIRFVEASA